MRILIVDTFGEYILDWAIRCLDDGHQVKWFSTQSEVKGQLSGKGIIERVPDFEKWKEWADLVFVADNTKYLPRMDQWRKDGIRVLGPSVETANWELDRKLGMSIFEKCGIHCPPYREFSDYDSAIAYVKKQDRAFVSKPSGVETDKALSYVAPNPEGLIYMLERWKKQSKLKGKFILQEKIKGIEFAVGGWFGPHGWNRGWEENWEHKKLMHGDLGPNCGEAGTVMRYVKKSRLADKVLKPLTDVLLKAGYVGCVDVNCIIDDLGNPWPLEFTNRPGVPAFQIQQALTDGDHANWMVDLCDGIDSQPIIYDQIAVGIVMAMPDYPYSHATAKEVVGIPLYGITPRNFDSIHLSMAMKGPVWKRKDGRFFQEDGLVTSGDYVLCATGVDDCVQGARDKALRVLDSLKDTPGSPFWRRDIGNRCSKDIPALQALGYATGARFSDGED